MSDLKVTQHSMCGGRTAEVKADVSQSNLTLFFYNLCKHKHIFVRLKMITIEDFAHLKIFQLK